jgi:hypothetical protein
MVPTAIDHHALLRLVLHLLKRKRIADHIAGQLAAALRIVRTNTDCVINRKMIYTKSDRQKIYDQAWQIRALITKYVHNPEVAIADDEEWEWRFDKIKTHYQLSVLKTVYQKFMLNDIHQLGFMRTFVDLVRQGRIDLAWEFFDLAIPSDYDLRQDYNLPIYKTKKIMKKTINNWLTTLEYWDEIKQLNGIKNKFLKYLLNKISIKKII